MKLLVGEVDTQVLKAGVNDRAERMGDARGQSEGAKGENKEPVFDVVDPGGKGLRGGNMVLAMGQAADLSSILNGPKDTSGVSGCSSS